MSTILVYFVQRDTPRLYLDEPTSGGILSHPVYQCRLEYLDEGGANFVFHIRPVEEFKREHTTRPVFHDRLLRLRKDLPHVPSAEDQLHALKTNFQGLFLSYELVEHTLVKLDEKTTCALNTMLQGVARPKHRIGDFLPNEPMSGLLVTDMTAREGEVLLQIKPKWLAQSHDAPSDAKRCRTCALRAQRASARIRTAADAQGTCPLDLVNTDPDERRRAVHAMTTNLRIREYLVNDAQGLLDKLRRYQVALDEHGALKTTSLDSIQSLCKAMTLRDCTLFLKQRWDHVDARLGDLDMKQPERLGRWRQIESDLISQGWYNNTEEDDHWTRERICSLSR